MKQLYTFYAISLKALTFLGFLALLWTNTLSNYWPLDQSQKAYEIYDPLDKDSEKEENKSEKEKEDQIHTHFHLSPSWAANCLANIFFTSTFQSLHHPEIQTPPPELSRV